MKDRELTFLLHDLYRRAFWGDSAMRFDPPAPDHAAIDRAVAQMKLLPDDKAVRSWIRKAATLEERRVLQHAMSFLLALVHQCEDDETLQSRLTVMIGTKNQVKSACLAALDLWNEENAGLLTVRQSASRERWRQIALARSNRLPKADEGGPRGA